MESQHEPLLEDQDDDEELESNAKNEPKLIYWIFLVYGVAMLLPWNVFITASDYFSSRFGNYCPDFQNYFSAYFNCANLVSLAILLKFQKPPVRIEIPLLINLLTFTFYAVTALLSTVEPASYFWITIGFMVVMGITTSMLQATVVAEASHLVPKYMQAVMSGQGIAGVSVSLFSLIIAASNAASFYFVYAIIITLTAIYGRRKQVTSFRYQESIRMTTNDQDHLHKPHPKQSIWDIIIKEIPGYIFTVIYIYVITLALFPSRTVQIVSVSGIDPSIFTSLHFLLFNVGDWIGRTIPLWCQVYSSRLLVTFALARTCFIPLFAHPFDSDLIFFVLLLLFSMSNGWLTSLVFMAAPQHQLQPSLVGRVMSFFLVVGLALGGLTSFLIIK